MGPWVSKDTTINPGWKSEESVSNLKFLDGEGSKKAVHCAMVGGFGTNISISTAAWSVGKLSASSTAFLFLLGEIPLCGQKFCKAMGFEKFQYQRAMGIFGWCWKLSLQMERRSQNERPFVEWWFGLETNIPTTITAWSVGKISASPVLISILIRKSTYPVDKILSGLSFQKSD
jgi:hypothetical protein